MPQHSFPASVWRACRQLALLSVLAACPLSAGTISAEYDVDAYDTTYLNVPYTLSIPTRGGTPISKIRAVVIYAPGVTAVKASGPVNSRWHKWLHANELAFLDVGDEYEAPASMLQVIANIGATAGYPELDNVPVMIFGESAGGTSAFLMAMNEPERTIAFVSEHTQYWDYPIPEAMKLVPGYFRWGEFDYERWANGYYDIDGDNLKDKLNEGAQWMCLGEDRQTHASMRYAVEEALGYFSLILPLRYTYEEGVSGHDPKLGPVTLNAIAREDGYLGEINMGAVQTPRYDLLTNLLKDWESTDPYTAPYATAERSDKLEHCWMPDAKTAAFWATKSTNGEHDLEIRYLDTLESDYGTDTYNNRSGYFPNLFTTDQQVRIEVVSTDFPNIHEMQFWMDDQIVGTDTVPPYDHAYTFTEAETGTHFIYPIAIAESGQRCVGRRRVIQVYSNAYGGNTSPVVSDIEHFTGRPGETIDIPFTVGDAETSAASLSVAWKHVNNTDDFTSTDYSASVSGTGENRVLRLTLPETDGIIWGMVQVSDGDMSVNEYVEVRVAGNDGYSPPFFVEGERVTSAGTIFMAGCWSKRISLHIFDYDTPLEDLTITATCNTQSLLPDDNIIVGGTGRFRYIQVKPIAVGYGTVTVTVSDGINSATTSFGVPSRDLANYVPVISDIPDQTVAGGRESGPVEARVYDLQTPGERFIDGETILALTVTSSDQSLVADGDISIETVGPRRLIRVTPSATNTGTATLTATVTDEGGLTAVDTFDVTVTVTGTLTVAGGDLPEARLGQGYTGTLDATGGLAPLSWTLVSGSLPTGLSLNADGSFSGTPQAAGDFTFTAEVSDGNSDTASAAFSIAVDPWLPLPGNFALAAESDSSVTVSWDDDAAGETGYEVQRRERDYLAWSTVVVTAANETSFNDDTVVAGSHYDYRVRTLGSAPSPWSEPLFIEVQAQPAIEIQPQSEIVLYQTSPVIDVVAHGGELTYQWYEGQSGDTSTPIAGATEKLLVIDLIEFTRSFWVRIGNGVGSIDSDTATLTVNQITWPLYLDFGAFSTPSPDAQGRHWNTIDFTNGTLSGLVDSVGFSTTISYSSVVAFTALFDDLDSLTTLYPSAVADDSAMAYGFGVSFKISGLEAGEDYDLTIFSSLHDTTNDYTTTFTVDGVSQSVNPANNASTFVVFENVTADASGEIAIAVDGRVFNAYSFITAMEISKSPDPLSLVASSTDVSVPENGSSTFDLTLNRAPDSDVTVTIAHLGDSDISIASSTTLTFTPSDWDQPQPVTLQAADDADTTDGTATIECTATGVVTATVTATEADDDLAIWVDASNVSISEGDSASFQVRLNNAPLTSCSVAVAWASGDENIYIQYGAQLSFNAGNFDQWQTVTLRATQDADTTDGTALISLTSATANSASVTVTEQDNDYTVVADGLLASWNLDSITSSPVVTEVAPGFLASGLASGLLTHSDPSEMRGASNGLKAIDNDETDLAAAITGGNCFVWTLELDAGHLINITRVVLRSKTDGSTMSVGLLCDAVGLNATDVLATSASGLQTADVAVAMEAVGDSVTFRAYGYGGANQYEGFYIGNSFTTDSFDDIQIYGTVAYSAPPTTFDSWASDEGVTPSEALDDDRDGLNNFLEYALRLDPNTPGMETPVVALANDYLTMAYRRNLEASDITYTVETSPDLVTWGTAVLESSFVADPDVDGDGTAQLVEVRVDMTGQTHQFIRLNVSQ